MPPADLVGARSARGRAAHASGLQAEEAACRALLADGWTILARRFRTGAGEIDIVSELDGLLVFAEVKRRTDLAGAAAALGTRQQARLMAAGEAALATNPGWGQAGVRFDVLVVDHAGRVRRVIDALRGG